MDSKKTINSLADIVRIDGTQARCNNIWFQQAEVDGDDLPIFRIAWGAARWGPWIGWN